MDEEVKPKEFPKACPVIDPLKEIKYKCDAIHLENMLFLQYMPQIMDKLLIIEKRFDDLEKHKE